MDTEQVKNTPIVEYVSLKNEFVFDSLGRTCPITDYIDINGNFCDKRYADFAFAKINNEASWKIFLTPWRNLVIH